MRKTARFQAAIEVVAEVEADLQRDVPTLDRRLADWGRRSRFAGSKDRRAVSDLAYQILRRRGSYLWAAQLENAPPTQRARILAGLAASEAGEPLQEVFAGDRHGPAPLSAAETKLLASAADRLTEPDAFRADMPPALLRELKRSVADPIREIARLRHRGAADLRVNSLKATRENALAQLSAENIAAETGPLCPTAIRLPTPVNILGADAFEQGLIEPQNAASQAAAALTLAHADETVVDYCAGGGGKSLSLAALMGGPRQGGGRLIAHDVSRDRMGDLPPRAKRAGARIECLDTAQLARLEGQADLVLVDAPCSGSGVWARNPDAKWTTGPARLAQLNRAQDAALSGGAALVRPGGRLVYVTCSLFASENQDRVAAFLERHPHFALGDLAAAWRAAGLAGAAPEPHIPMAGATLIAPSQHETDGFFVALLERSSSAV
ncbi:MAG: RsmB/NOP family class I SAM-dependent RNA methyltransferase [Neomegalonema sp.]|nr:RsmB/NOP family class I SAM-dependent RNA methyltransferase [Neomegalonema sp.]